MTRTSAWMLSIVALASLFLAGADWPQFRGPQATGVAADSNPPEKWSATENVAWKTALPGFGASSPIVVGDQVFVTCYSGYGLSEDDAGKQEDLAHHVVCVNRADGKIVWDKKTKAALPETEYRSFITLHGYASATPASDGKTVYAFFGRSGVYAYSLTGDELWHVEVGTGLHKGGWGSAASPILYKDLLIVNACIESGSLVALDKSNGKEVWRVSGIKDSWATPLLVEAKGRTEVVLSHRDKVLAVDPATGKKLWESAGVKDYICPSATAEKDVIYVTGARKAQTLAIRAGGSGDVTKTATLWESAEGSKVPTPVYHDGRLHWIDVNGFAICLDAKTGKRLYKERLELKGRGEKVYASMVLAGDKLFAVTREGGTVVLALGPEFRELARNDLGDASVFNATPAVTGNQLLLRSNKFLYCIGK